MFELIPVLAGAVAATLLATRRPLAYRIAIAALGGASIAMASGESAVWAPAPLADAVIAVGSCVAVAFVRQRLARPGTEPAALGSRQG
jgi:hypothetical protein